MTDVGAELGKRLKDFNDMNEARERKRHWEGYGQSRWGEGYGQSRWGFGVAHDVIELEQRVAALEKLVASGDAQQKPVTEVQKHLHAHDAAPAARARTDGGSTGADNAGTLTRQMGTGDTTSPGDGWRLLEPGEVIREGDEFHTRYGWTRTYRVGSWPDPQTTYRRRQTAPPCVETDGPSSRKCVPPVAETGSGVGQPPGVPQPDNGLATGGRGQNTQEAITTHGECSDPVLWAVFDRETGSPLSVHLAEKYAMESAGCGSAAKDVVPLYRQPQPTLTDEEREAIATAMHAYGENNADEECAEIEATLWRLLERTQERNHGR